MNEFYGIQNSPLIHRRTFFTKNIFLSVLKPKNKSNNTDDVKNTFRHNLLIPKSLFFNTFQFQNNLDILYLSYLKKLVTSVEKNFNCSIENVRVSFSRCLCVSVG